MPGSRGEDTAIASDSLDRWFGLVYECLRDLAGQWFRRESPGHTLQPTAFVHEAYLRLAEGGPIRCDDPAHFFALAATVMRRVLVDHARRKAAAKRGGDRRRMSLQELDGATGEVTVDILDLDQALQKLAKSHERPSRIIEMRFFGGLTIDQAAQVLGVSPRTVDLDWRFARAWLMRELEGAIG
ncbi:MAG: ECF-type sigma factor [Planctomycetota bacterium]|jgi:RNA polymerase sigma factor (TIGR02999 family)